MIKKGGVHVYWLWNNSDILESYIKMELKDKYIIRNTKFRKSFG
jgi:hypothetical protein